MKYRCSKCMYEYDEDVEGENFDDLSEDWRCPECGGQVYYFEKQDNSSNLNDTIDELDNETKDDTSREEDFDYSQIITKKEIVGLIILSVFCFFIGWGIVSLCNFLINNM